jgi:DNA-binding transcriptional MerR regulator
VGDDDLLSIGTFAMVSGLSVNALRHYDEIGLPKPASVDADTCYRRYRPGQLPEARLIRALRAIDLPIDSVREALADPAGDALSDVLRRHRQQLEERARALSRAVATVDYYLEHGVAMPEPSTPRISQVTINVTDLAKSITFYQAAFGASFNEDISSFQFGTWPASDFFLLTVSHEPNQHGAHVGPTGTSRFGLMVDDVDAAHRRALDAGADEHCPPEDNPWKPRSSCVIDPSGNWIDLYQN